MKYNFDSYMLYHTGKIIKNVARARFIMKHTVDMEVLKESINTATDRYPYFKKKITVNEEGAYILEDNNAPVVVLPIEEKIVPVGSKEVNYHMLYVAAKGKEINFYISHSLTGGNGLQPWIMTCLYCYISNKFNVNLNAPFIRKPESDFLPTELTEPTYDLLSKEKSPYKYEVKKAASIAFDYLNGFFNPFMKKEEYYVFTFNAEEFVKLSKENNVGVASLFTILMFKTMYKALPKKDSVIRAGLAHNPFKTLGIPDSHCDFLSHIFVDYTGDMASLSLKELGAYTKEQMEWQKDFAYLSEELRKKFKFREGIDNCIGLKNKRKYANKNNMNIGKNCISGTYRVNYTGYADWGDLAEYIQSLFYVVDGHCLTEGAALGDKIIFTFMALVKAEKYINALCAVLEDEGINYKLEGPYPKNLPYQEFRRK